MTADIDANLKKFLGDRVPEARYASFDYCYNHFQEAREIGWTAQLADDDHRMLSCLQLGFYLASWGMMRGSGDLLYRSVRDLMPVVERIAAEPADVWDLGAGSLATDADAVLALSGRIRKAFTIPASDILVTKTMLGVFGCIPAFDRYFRLGFGCSTLCKHAGRARHDLAERLVEVVLSVLERAGFRGQALASAFNVLVGSLVGWVSLELAADPSDIGSDWQDAFATAVRSLPAADFPVIVANFEVLADRVFTLRWHGGADRPMDESFAAAVDSWISGLVALRSP